MGLSSTKTVAKIATGEAKPNGQINIDFGEEKPFMAPLSHSENSDDRRENVQKSSLYGL